MDFAFGPASSLRRSNGCDGLQIAACHRCWAIFQSAGFEIIRKLMAPGVNQSGRIIVWKVDQISAN